MDKSITRIIKVGEFRFMKALYEHGEMYFRPIDEFRINDTNRERFDTYEGASEIDQIEWLKIQAENGKIYELSIEKGKAIHLSSANLITYTNIPKGNIFCCTGVTTENESEFQSINPKFREFGDTVLLIENPNEFLSRVESNLQEMKMDFRIGLVDYYNPSSKIGSLSVYNKKEEHSYQSEIRIWINYTESKAITLRIGSIKDIACLFKLEELLTVKKTTPNN